MFASFTRMFALSTQCNVFRVPSGFSQVESTSNERNYSAAPFLGLWHGRCCGIALTAVERGEALRLITLRNSWSDLDSVEKAAVMLGLLALTLAAWVLGSVPAL